MSISPDHPAGPPEPPAQRPWWALAVALVALVGAGVLFVRGTPGAMAPTAMPPDGQQQMIAVSPAGSVELATLEPELQELYRAVAADEAAFTAVRCYCGCETMLSHRHLLDCFVRPDGGWERHAVGCAVCQAEARDVVAARDAGTALDDIVADIDATYGGITEPQRIDDQETDA